MLGRRSICIDPKNGIFLVRKISKGIDTPIHVQKKTTSNGISRCEADECIDCVEAVSRGQHPGFECVHLRAIQFAEPFVPQTPLDDNVLDKMVDKYKWLSESRQRECFALRNKADREGVSLVYPWIPASNISQRFFHFSVLTNTTTPHYWCRLGRCIVCFDTKEATWKCSCSPIRRSCVHKSVSKWYVLQLMPNLITTPMMEDEDVLLLSGFPNDTDEVL